MYECNKNIYIKIFPGALNKIMRDFLVQGNKNK